MAGRPRKPAARAKAEGSDRLHPGRHAGRNEPIVTDHIGGPPDWLSEKQREAWALFVDEIPWLNKSHRGVIEIACTYRGRLMAGEDVGVQGLNILRQIYAQCGATPADASKVTLPEPPKAADPADEFFSP